jgi:TPP-dependent pyruvate/acetoin dehydrogenase alpha subunit
MTTHNKESASASDGFSLIPKQKLLALYATMLECRRVVERSQIESVKSKLHGSVNSIMGQEAAAVGAAIDLLPADTVVPTNWPVAVLRAINPSVSIASRISIVSSPVLPNEDCRNVSVLFSSRERTNQAPWQKAQNFAVTRKLPTIFVSFIRPQSSSRPIDVLNFPPTTKSSSLPSISVDGNDVVAVYRVATEAIAHARRGHGPTLIDCQLVNPGDPLQNMKKYLMGKGLVDEKVDGWANDKVSEWV